MEPVWVAALVSLATFLMTAGLVLWRGGRNSANNTLDLGKMESRLAQTIAETARDLEDRQDSATKNIAESIAGLRQQMELNEKETMTEVHGLSDQIRRVEIWARDEFVRKESFREICARIENTVAEQGRNMNIAVQSVRDAIMSLETGNKFDKHDHTS